MNDPTELNAFQLQHNAENVLLYCGASSVPARGVVMFPPAAGEG